MDPVVCSQFLGIYVDSSYQGSSYIFFYLRVVGKHYVFSRNFEF